MALQELGYDGIVWDAPPTLEPTDNPDVLAVKNFRRPTRKDTLRKDPAGGWNLWEGNEMITGYYSPEDFLETNSDSVFVVFEPTKIK